MPSRSQQCFVARGFSVALLILVITLGIIPRPALAQLESATINGTVTDPTGAVIAGAKVTLRNVGTSVEKVTTSNGSGRYVLIDIAPGTYTMLVSIAGFSTASQPEFTLYVNQSA